MPRLFCDLDGVMADFDGAIEALCGTPPRDIQDEALWEIVGKNLTFWSDLPLMPDAMALWEVIKPFNPVFLTGCPRTGYERASIDKPRWVRAHFGDNAVITCRSKDKPTFMEAKGDILIDDFVANIKRWEKAGGVPIYHRNAERTIPQVLKLMNGETQ